MYKTLVYCGVNGGATFKSLIPKFDRCIGFEPYPVYYNRMLEWFVNNPKVEMYNYAVGNTDEIRDFHIYANNAASSLSTYTEITSAGRSKLEKTIKVQCVHLGRFLHSIGVSEIDYYFSDIQGMDYTALETLRPFIEKKKIRKITCEVDKDGRPSLYKGLNNKFSMFERLLNTNYHRVLILTEAGWISQDVTWVLKDCIGGLE